MKMHLQNMEIPVLRAHFQIIKYISLEILSGGFLKFQTRTGTIRVET